jgi:hypothetical protein
MARLAADLGGQLAQHRLKRLLVPGLDLPGEHKSHRVSRSALLCNPSHAARATGNCLIHSNQ